MIDQRHYISDATAQIVNRCVFGDWQRKSREFIVGHLAFAGVSTAEADAVWRGICDMRDWQPEAPAGKVLRFKR